MGFIESMIDKARIDKKTIVLPESYEPRTIEACARILQQGIADIVLIGHREKIRAVSPQWDISGARVIDPATSPDFENFVQTFYELRKAKGMTLDKARETMLDPLFTGS
jgi:phosphate acetyltransferase